VNARLDAGSEREDRLDRYRQTVESLLGEAVALAGDDDFEALFEHVLACFDDGLDEASCARTWLSRQARPA
jgi:hypothetical protein